MSETRWVLIAEDDDDIRKLIRDSLESESEGINLQVIEARDGLDAISKVSNREFHCVVTDLKMPRSTGIELIRAMQSNALNANTPKVVVTAAETEDFAEIANSVRVFAKPFEPTELARTVIREIKLGRMDDRVALHMMNPFLKALQTFLEKDATLNCHVHQPSVNKSGEGLVGDVHCNLLITSGVSRNRFTFSFDISLLEFLKAHYFQSRSIQWATLTHESIARQICQLVFDHAVAGLQAQMGLVPRLAGTAIYTYKNEVEYSEMVRTNGVTVVIKTDHGRIIAGAFAKPKPRRV